MRICVLDDVYKCPAWEAPQEDWRVDPTPFLKGHDWSVEGLTKETVVPTLTRLVRDGVDLFFNLLAGAWDQKSPGMEVVLTLERLGVPFTGATSEFFEPSREAMKRVCSAWGIPYPGYLLVRTDRDIDRAAGGLRFPLIVKHPSSYSSVGLTRDSRVETTFALRYRARRMMESYGAALVEEFIEGREFTVLVAENPDDPTRPVTFLPIEFTFPPGDRFKYSDLKWKNFRDMKEVPVRDPELGGGALGREAEGVVSPVRLAAQRRDLGHRARGPGGLASRQPLLRPQRVVGGIGPGGPAGHRPGGGDPGGLRHLREQPPGPLRLRLRCRGMPGPGPGRRPPPALHGTVRPPCLGLRAKGAAEGRFGPLRSVLAGGGSGDRRPQADGDWRTATVPWQQRASAVALLNPAKKGDEAFTGFTGLFPRVARGYPPVRSRPGGDDRARGPRPRVRGKPPGR